jgi:hypothetical protein
MKKNLLYYSLYIPENKNMDYYSMLYYSLYTLEQFKNNNFDIVVYYCSPFKNLKQYSHVDKNSVKYNLFDRFNYVHFIESDYNKNGIKVGANNFKLPFAAFHKWYCLHHACTHGHDAIFSIDCDVIYRTSIDYFFDKYKPTEKKLYCLKEGYSEPVVTVLGENGVCGGQHIIKTSTILNNPTLYSLAIKHYNLLDLKSKKLLPDEKYKWFINLAEQYAVQMAFNELDINMDVFDCSDICYGEGLFNEKIINNKIILENIKPNIFHYFGSNAFKVLPEQLQTNNMQEKYVNYIKNKL